MYVQAVNHTNVILSIYVAILRIIISVIYIDVA